MLSSVFRRRAVVSIALPFVKHQDCQTRKDLNQYTDLIKNLYSSGIDNRCMCNANTLMGNFDSGLTASTFSIVHNGSPGLLLLKLK